MKKQTIDQPQAFTFEIEKLERPDGLLQEKEREVFIGHIAKDYVYASPLPATMAVLKSYTHPFLQAMYHAYEEHRPFVISPDMICLLICQGFSQHVNKNSEALRHKLVAFEGKETLIVRNNELVHSPDEWANVIPEFIGKISQHVPQELLSSLIPDFTTSTPHSILACQVTVMDALKAYFEYIAMTCICGIPEITLEGSAEDWQRLKEKMLYLAQFDMDWWADAMTPILDQLIATSLGNVDVVFWRNMFKEHTPEGYGATPYINGWIGVFFPYTRQGLRRKDFNEFRIDSLPSEQTSTPLTWIIDNGLDQIVKEMEIVAGFFGVSQNIETQALKPEIGWAVAPSAKQSLQLSKKQAEGISSRFKMFNFYHLTEVPSVLFDHKEIGSLSLYFSGRINIQPEFGKIKIGTLSLFGEINSTQKGALLEKLPLTEKLYINGQREFREPDI